MASDLIRLYISLLSEFFTLSDIAVSSPNPDSAATLRLPPFVPQHSHALTTAHYLARILSDIKDCVTEVMATDISSDASSGMKGLLESARWRFENALTSVWLRGEPNLN